nr:RHS repeat-associated core domain-containing protein [Pseudomonas sp. PGPR40]
MGFNGQLREARIGWYLLGNGYRAFNSTLMRFHSPDSWSPFGRGGLNPYMYCVGDPVNRSDPTGHAPFLPGLRKFVSGVDKFFFGGADITGPSRSKALKASAPLGPMSPENTGEGKAFRTIGTIVAGAPGARSHPNSRPLVESGSTTPKSHPGYPIGAARDGLTTMGNRSTTHLIEGGGSTSYFARTRSSSFDAPRTLWQGDPPRSPILVHERLLGGGVPSAAPNAATNNGPSGGTHLSITPPSSPSPSRWSGESGESDWSRSSSSSSSSSPPPVLVNLIRRSEGSSLTRWVGKR